MKLTDELMSAFWADAELTVDDQRRMKAVMVRLSDKIRTWAPDEGQARICYLAINEVADRLVRETEEAA